MNIGVTSFNSGELSPHLDARTDFERYATGCRRLENMLPLPYGDATRRPGSRYLGTTKNDPEGVRLIPFIYSATTNYLCEFGKEYIRFWYNRALLTDGGSAVEVVTPYAVGDLPLLQTRQIGDVMWIVHPDYAPRKLSRTSDTAFSLDTIDFEKGPFKLRNDLAADDLASASTMTYASTVVDGYTENDDGNSILGVYLMAQTFTASASYDAKYLRLRLSRPRGAPGTMTASIRACTTDDPATAVPTGSDLAVGYASGNNLTMAASGEWCDFVLDRAVPLTIGKMYAVVLQAGSGYNEVLWRQDKSSPTYTDGAHVYYWGGDWTRMEAGTDCMFSVGSEELTLTCSEAFFDSDHHVGALFKLTYSRSPDESYGTISALVDGGDTEICPPIDVEGEFSLTTRGTWAGTIKLQRSENGEAFDTVRTYRSNSDSNFSLTLTEDSENVRYQLIATAFSSGTIQANINVYKSTQDVVAKITGVNSTTEALVEIISGTPRTTATQRWAEGAWSDYQGWPGSVTSLDNRIIYAGTASSPQSIWLSAVDDYDNFREGVEDDDSFEIVMLTTSAIRSVGAMDALAAVTSGGVARVSSNKLEQPITPTNFTVKEWVTTGGATLEPIKVGSCILYLDAVKRRIREFSFSADRQEYVAQDLTRLAEHITSGGITCMSFMQHPEPILWAFRSDGTLLSMTYNRTESVIAWAQHMQVDAKTTDDLAQSIAVLPGTNEDEVYMSVLRTVNGVQHRYIEVIYGWEQGDLDDSFFVDCGIKYSGVAAKSITGLDHLEGETVQILADGVVVADQEVTNGAITLKTAATPVVVGLPQVPVLQPMRIAVADSMGAMLGSRQRIAEVALSLLDSAGVKIGATEEDARTLPDDDGTALITGDRVATIDGGFDPDQAVVITSTDPLPMTVRALIVRQQRTGR